VDVFRAMRTPPPSVDAPVQDVIDEVVGPAPVPEVDTPSLRFPLRCSRLLQKVLLSRCGRPSRPFVLTSIAGLNPDMAEEYLRGPCRSDALRGY
jgi:hypothetical protein